MKSESYKYHNKPPLDVLVKWLKDKIRPSIPLTEEQISEMAKIIQEDSFTDKPTQNERSI